jgi:hypothetical protein
MIAWMHDSAALDPAFDSGMVGRLVASRLKPRSGGADAGTQDPLAKSIS